MREISYSSSDSESREEMKEIHDNISRLIKIRRESEPDYQYGNGGAISSSQQPDASVKSISLLGLQIHHEYTRSSPTQFKLTPT